MRQSARSPSFPKCPECPLPPAVSATSDLCLGPPTRAPSRRCEAPRFDDLRHRATRRRCRFAGGRNESVVVDRRGPRESAASGRTERVAGAYHNDEGRAAPTPADDGPTGGSTARASAYPQRASAVSHRHTVDCECIGGEASSSGSCCESQEQRAAHPSAHVLFPLGDAGRPGAGDSGTRRTSRHRRRSSTYTSVLLPWTTRFVS